jgi:serine protease AprX
MADDEPAGLCPACGQPSAKQLTVGADWFPPDVQELLDRRRPEWRHVKGLCPACVQQALLHVFNDLGDAALRECLQSVWPLDAEAAFGAIPTPLRMHADPRFTGAGVTVAFVDSGFYPHPDLTRPENRIRAWVDAGREPVVVHRFGHAEEPRWPGWDAGHPWQWHGLMTSVSAAGNGLRSDRLYRGLASGADVVLVQARDAAAKRVTSASIARALRWLLKHGPGLGVRVVNLSVAGDPGEPLAGHPVDTAVEALVNANVAVVAAAGNEGKRHLVPPATAPLALTVGGIDDQNSFAPEEVRLWNSNYGQAETGSAKPELVAPSIWIAAPVLPGSGVAREAEELWPRRGQGDEEVERRIAELKLVTPHYQHVDGTSFAAPIVSSVLACMLEANPKLSALRLRELALAATLTVPGAEKERQGGGVIVADWAVKLALADRDPAGRPPVRSPLVTTDAVLFRLLEPSAADVRVLGSWDSWSEPGVLAAQVEPAIWQARLPRPPSGAYQYRWVLERGDWRSDPTNPHREDDPEGRPNSVLYVP